MTHQSVQTPEWVRHAVFYQIFPDRFAISPTLDKPNNLEPWDSPPTSHGFKGGDLIGVVEHLDYLQANPEAEDRDDHVNAIVGLPEPAVKLLAARVVADSHGPEPLLEGLTRRYYKIRTLEDVESFVRDDRQFVTGSFDLNGQQLHLISAVTDFDGLADTAQSAAALGQ